MRRGVVRPFSHEMAVSQDSHCIVLLVEFLVMTSTETAAATVVHQLQLTLGELPCVFHNRQVARLLQRNWAKRLFHRLSRGVW